MNIQVIIDAIPSALTLIFCLLAILGALILFFQQNPVRAALGLLLSMVSMGAIFLAIGAQFMGFGQLMVYAGAIVILFLFAVMHFPVGKIRRDRIPSIQLLGVLWILVLLGIFVANLLTLGNSDIIALPIAPRQNVVNEITAIGSRFLTDWIYPFELISVLLLIAVVAYMHITRPFVASRGGDGDAK